MEVHVSLVGRKDLTGEIYRQLRRAILDGRLPPGGRLPPTRELLAPGDRVAVESPGYGPPRRLMASLGAEVVGVPVDDQGLVVEAIPPGARLVYVTPSHQFPLGMALSLPRRLALLA